MEWKRWKGKRIFVILQSKHVYSGDVIDVDKDFIYIIDKFGKDIIINTRDIKIIKEEDKHD